MGKAKDDELGDAGHIDPRAICCEDSGFNWGLSKPSPQYLVILMYEIRRDGWMCDAAGG